MKGLIQGIQRHLSVITVFLAVTLPACTQAPSNTVACEPGSTNLLSDRIVHTYGANSSGNPEHGKNLFISLCANCHTQQGVNAINKSIRSKINQPTSPKLACNKQEQNLSEAYLFATIKHGKSNNVQAHSMPAWKELLSDEEILDLVAYLLLTAKQAE